MAEAEDLKSSQCGFDPHSGHRLNWAYVLIDQRNYGLVRFNEEK